MKKISNTTARSQKPSARRRPRTQGARLEVALVAFARFAKRRRLRWYVFGAQAVNLHGFPRTTADLDVTIELRQRDPLSVTEELARAGFVPRFQDPAFIAATRVIPVVHRATGMPIDLVLAGPGLEERFLDEVVVRKVGRTSVPVLSVENLVVTKLLAARPKDLEDVRELTAIRDIDHDHVEELLAVLEDALDQDDLRPLYRRIRK